MDQVLTLVCKLQPTPEQAQKLSQTVVAFADACNWVNKTTDPKLTNRITLQALAYKEVRVRFGLSANLSIQAIRRVAANRKVAKQKKRSVKGFAPTSADYDARIFSFREKDWTVSLTTVDGRERMPIQVGNYQRGKLAGQQPTSAQLCLHRDGQFYIHIQIDTPCPEPPKGTNKVIGVDFGRREIARTSTGKGWCGEQITQVRDRFSRVRASLQKKASKGTRSTRRRARQVLARLSGRERRYQQWLNHSISAALVKEAKAAGAALAIEDLTGLRERTNQQPRNRTERRRSNSWAFYQLRMFLAYKCAVHGVELVAVNPAYTSQTCHRCLHIGLRTDKRFVCANTDCGWKGDADDNGAQMIALLGAAVNQPARGPLCCSLEHQAGLPKACALA
jgi:IS605 OrfB family transposase